MTRHQCEIISHWWRVTTQIWLSLYRISVLLPNRSFWVESRGALKNVSCFLRLCQLYLANCSWHSFLCGFYPHVLILTFIIKLPAHFWSHYISIGYKRNCVKQTALIFQTILFCSLSLIYHFTFSSFGSEVVFVVQLV